jgi:PTS system mannose-specific IIC component
MSNLLLGLILGLWSGVAMVLDLSGLRYTYSNYHRNHFRTLCRKRMDMGLKVGSVMLINSLGFYTYGGATIPDFITGSIFGTVVGAKSGSMDAGIVVAQGISLLMTQMDILGRSTTTVFQHLGEAALAQNNIPKFELMTLWEHYLGFYQEQFQYFWECY